jgi:hypothetical protein
VKFMPQDRNAVQIALQSRYILQTAKVTVFPYCHGLSHNPEMPLPVTRGEGRRVLNTNLKKNSCVHTQFREQLSKSRYTSFRKITTAAGETTRELNHEYTGLQLTTDGEWV